MSLIIEDGTIVAGAESYASVSDADVYLSSRGITTWTDLLNIEREQALRRATDYMREYAWKGQIVDTVQALDWPRQKIFIWGSEIANNVIPKEVKNACIELAWRGASGPLNPDMKSNDASNRYITKQVQRVGPIDVETTFASRGQMAAPTRPVYPAVNVMLKRYVNAEGGVIR